MERMLIYTLIIGLAHSVMWSTNFIGVMMRALWVIAFWYLNQSRDLILMSSPTLRLATPYLGGATISFNYTGDAQDVKAYELAGSLHGFASSVSLSIEAHEFELHILEIDEPARQS